VIAALRTEAAHALTRRFGDGHWSTETTERGALGDLRHAEVWAARLDAEVVGTYRLGTRKPWAIDESYFTDVKRAVYLTNMAVRPDCQRRGIGRECIEHAIERARAWPAQAIRLDAYDADAGAGEFYRKCGLREVGRVVYRTTPLLYFELLV
jgi:ribosomal protein S18 acetylase RimI-like enzyme